MLEAEYISNAQQPEGTRTFRVHFSAKVGDIVSIFTTTNEYPTRITKVCSVEDGMTIICIGVAASDEAITARYKLTKVQEAEVRLVPRKCTSPLPMGPLSLLSSPLFHVRWGVCDSEVVVWWSTGLLVCPVCDMVLLRETEVL